MYIIHNKHLYFICIADYFKNIREDVYSIKLITYFFIVWTVYFNINIEYVH